MFQPIANAVTAIAFLAALSAPASSETFWMDLTHPLPTFQPVPGSPDRADLGKPWLNSMPHVAWDQQAILSIDVFQTDTGYYDSGTLTVYEHHGTHLDAVNHIINSEDTLIEGGIPNDARLGMSELTPADLIGPIVMLDIGPRVRAELAKNGGVPSPDISVTDFSDSSKNVVTAEDIDAVADQLVDGTWLVVNMDWARFYLTGSASLRNSPYFNNFNHPGLNHAAIDRLAQIIDERELQLGGIAMDNITIDTGQGAKGAGAYPMQTNAWYSHTVLMQRGVLFVENLAEVNELAEVMNAGAACTLIVGAPKHVRGTGGPSRAFAMCES